MTCNGCVKHVDGALRSLPGVTAVEVDLAAGQAHVVHDERASLGAMIAAVDEAGYQATSA